MGRKIYYGAAEVYASVDNILASAKGSFDIVQAVKLFNNYEIDAVDTAISIFLPIKIMDKLQFYGAND